MSNLSQNLLSLAQVARSPALAASLLEAAEEARALELRASEATEMKAEVPEALRLRSPVLEGAGWVRAMRYRISQLEAHRPRSMESDVEAFHHKFGHPAPGAPRVLSGELAWFRSKLIREESEELLCKLDELDEHGSGAFERLAGLAGEACDLLYVTLGTLVAAGLPVQPFWDEVHRANMAKEPNPEGGKPLKPAGWTPPDLSGVLNQCRRSSS